MPNQKRKRPTSKTPPKRKNWGYGRQRSFLFLSAPLRPSFRLHFTIGRHNMHLAIHSWMEKRRGNVGVEGTAAVVAAPHSPSQGVTWPWPTNRHRSLIRKYYGAVEYSKLRYVAINLWHCLLLCLFSTPHQMRRWHNRQQPKKNCLLLLPVNVWQSIWYGYSLACSCHCYGPLRSFQVRCKNPPTWQPTWTNTNWICWRLRLELLQLDSLACACPTDHRFYFSFLLAPWKSKKEFCQIEQEKKWREDCFTPPRRQRRVLSQLQLKDWHWSRLNKSVERLGPGSLRFAIGCH